MKRLLVLLLLLSVPVVLIAQSVPNPSSPISLNTVWTVAQWIAAWQSKVDVTGGSSTGQTLTNPAISGGTISGTNQSAGNVTSTGSTTARMAGVRAADVINVLDWCPAGQPDGTTDDTTCLQNAITAGPGKVVYIPNATSHWLHGGLTVPSNTHLVIDGTLYLKNSAGVVHSINGTSVSNVVIDGDDIGVIDGNKANQSGAGGSDVFFIQSSNIIVRNLTAQNAQRSGVNVEQSSNILLDNLTLPNNTHANQCSGAGDSTWGFPTGSMTTNCWARNLNISGTADYGFAFYDGVSNSGIVDSVVTGTTGGPGMGLLSDGGTLLDNDILIRGNVISGTTGSNYGLVVTQSISGTHTYVTIENNHIVGGASGGVDILNAKHVTVDNNEIYNNTAGAGGIVIDSGTEDYTVRGNILRGNLGGVYLGTCSQGIVADNLISNSNDGTGNAKGINMPTVGGVTYTLVTGNNIFDDQGVPTLHFGMVVKAGAGTVISGNYINSTVASPMTFVSEANDLQYVEVPTLSVASTAVRVVTASGAITQLPSDSVIVVNKTTGAASAVALIARPAGSKITIKDGKGDANTNNITITPAAGNIDGSSTKVISTAYGVATLVYNGAQWNSE